MWLHRARLLQRPPNTSHRTLLDIMRHTINLHQQRLPLCTAKPSQSPTFQTRAPTLIQRAAAVALLSDEHSEESSKAAVPPVVDAPRAVVPSATSVGARLAAAPRQTKTGTGQFPRLPVVPPAHELIVTAVKRAERVSVPKTVKNEAQRAKARAARLLDTLTKEVAVPLGKLVRGFPPPSALHPFEAALLQLTVGEERYERTLARVDALRKSVLEVGKSHAGRAAKCITKKEALLVAQEGIEAVQRVYAKGAVAVDSLKEVAKSLRTLPVVDLRLPTVALVGAPNVGKSSLVQVISSGTPEVCNYPFTTRSIKMGHFYVDGRRHQVTDTPGLLNRPAPERNAMERLTLACLLHLPTTVVFVMDLTEECGTTVAEQWAIRSELRAAFPEKPWTDVLSKADLLEEEFDAADSLAHIPAPPTQAGPVEGALGVFHGAPGTDAALAGAVQVAAMLPHAVRVSSMRGDGLDALQECILDMCEAATAHIS